jgi:integrase/recombinase XerD
VLLAQVQRVLAIPMKRFERPLVGFLSREEMEVILAAPDAATWTGQRDRLLILLLYNTGARISELIGIRRGDVDTSAQAVHLHGQGRKERVVPLWKRTAQRLVEADLAMKEHALASLQPPETATPRFIPKPDVLAFLDSL